MININHKILIKKMILNRKKHNKKNKKIEIHNSNEEEENEVEEEEEEEMKPKKKEKNKKHHKNKNKVEHEEEEEEEDENQYEYYERPKKEKLSIFQNKTLIIEIIASIVIVIFVLTLIIKIKSNKQKEYINLSISNTNSTLDNNTINQAQPPEQPKDEPKEEPKREQKEEQKEEPKIEPKDAPKPEPKEDIEKNSKEMLNEYNSKGSINIIKYFKENILKQEYKLIEKPNHIHISIAINSNNIDEYIKHISSILISADKEATYIHLHLMDIGEFNYDSFTKLIKMVDNINKCTEIIIYNATPALKDFTIKPESKDKFSIEYAKLYAFKILALKDEEKIILLDGDDIIVKKDLDEFYNLNMNDIMARGLPEEPGLKGPIDWIDKYILDKSHYINCGVLLINLKMVQSESIYDKAIKLNNDEFYMKTESPAQDIINILMRKKIEFFGPKFNKINFYENEGDKYNEELWYNYMKENLRLGEKNNHFYTKDELTEADKDPVIIHYHWDKELNKVIVNYEEEKKKNANLAGLII